MPDAPAEEPGPGPEPADTVQARDLAESSRSPLGPYETLLSHTLALVANGAELPRVLDSIVRGLESAYPAAVCSISLLARGPKQLDSAPVPGPSDFYNEALARTETCIGSCWSQPIRAASGQTSGTLTVRHRDERTPGDADLAILERSAHLAAIAVERSIDTDRLRESDSLFRLLTEDTRFVVWKVDRDLRFTYISPADERLRGYTAGEMIGRSVLEMFTEEGIAALTEIMHARRVAEQHGTRTGSLTFECQHRCKDGRLLWGEIFSTPVRDAHGAIVGFHGITRENTERRHMEEQVRQLAFYDTLTNLPNRRMLDDRLSQTMAASKRTGRWGALMFLDLDNFKSLNDTQGHEIGDLLLIEAANRLRRCVRETDTVARIGGDEFVVMLSGLDVDPVVSKSQAKTVADKIRTTLLEPYRLTTQREANAGTVVEHHCTVSIGVALFAGHGASAENILKWADMAMYGAKEEGRNRIRIHDGANG